MQGVAKRNIVCYNVFMKWLKVIRVLWWLITPNRRKLDKAGEEEVLIAGEIIRILLEWVREMQRKHNG